jgi:hypothetical protein
MTDAPTRRTRLSKGRVRAVAWITGGATLLTGIGVLGASPTPTSSGAADEPATGRPAVIVRRVVRRVIVTDPAPGAPVRVIPGAASSVGSSAGGTSAGTPAPVTTTTGGS